MASVASRVTISVKRALVGRALHSGKLEHQLLPKRLALPVFASDPLSSNAYATEEMMLILVTAGSVALVYKLPIALAIAAVILIVITSYRQTVRAYPRGGGSYIVAKENLGKLPGLLAAAAILTDYVLTVTVSVTAGTIAVTSAVPELVEHKVGLALGFIGFIAVANLRGAREAGTLFALPTYGFVAMIYVMLVTGFVRCLDGCPVAETATVPLEPLGAVTVFLILRAFATGSTALTGIEAIADGVQAFRKPQGRNAAATLAMLGAMTTTMFIGITWLSSALQVRVTEEIALERSVISQVGETVFGRGGMFFTLQAFTALILILAANTAYQDFPRLSSILARDRFMPRQFMNRGDRLVFSNGIIVLSLLAGFLVWMFDAELTRLIKLYVVGVFTAFTLSQAGMVRRWRRLRSEGWKRNAVINGIGATTTGLVLLVVAVTKFTDGAWMVLIAMPAIISLLLLVNRHYEDLQGRLRARGLSPSMDAENHVVALIPDLGQATREMVSWLRAVRPEHIRPLYIGDGSFEDAAGEWDRVAPRLGALERLEAQGGQVLRALRAYVRAIPRGEDDFVTVVVPEEITSGLLLYVLRRTRAFRIKAGLLFEPGVCVTDVPLLPVERELAGLRPVEERPLEVPRNVCIVPVSGMHDGTARALSYARSLHPAKLEAIYLAGEPEEADQIAAEWRDREVDIPLSIVEAPFRDYGPPILEEIRRHTRRGDTLVTVVLPEFVVEKWRHQLLHNQRALYFKRILLFEPWTVAVSVPFHLANGVRARAA
jgi:amino acid transporter